MFDFINIHLKTNNADAPGRPRIVDWDRNRVDLDWTPPKNDGGRP